MRRTVFALFTCLALPLTCSGATIFATDFEAGAPPELSGAGGLTSVAGFPAAAGLGASAWQNASAGDPALPTTIELTGLGAHTRLDVGFDFIAFDSWDGVDPPFGPDYLTLSIGASSHHHSVTNFPASIKNHFVVGPFNFSAVALTFFDGNSHGGATAYPDSVWRVTFSIPHVGNTASLSFFANGAGWQGGSDESFGLDNIVVDIDSVAVPEPSALALLGAGLAQVLLAARRRTR